MCGRFAMNNETNALLEEIVAAHGASAIFNWQKFWPPNYNVAPTQQVPVAADLAGQRLIESVRWGMVAPYSKEFGGKPTINARIETVATNGMFKKPFQEHRVVVPAGEGDDRHYAPSFAVPVAIWRYLILRAAVRNGW